MILCVPFPKAAIDFARDKEIEEERRREINSLENYLENIKIRWAEFQFPRENARMWRAVVWFVDRYVLVKKWDGFLRSSNCDLKGGYLV